MSHINCKVGDVVYNRKRNGFQQIKRIEGNVVILSWPCSYYEDSKTTIGRMKYPLCVVNVMLKVNESKLHLYDFVYYYKVIGYRVYGETNLSDFHKWWIEQY